jgi:MoaA/NifB/PqqE/SkfB family radical SAM enzyme
MNSLLNRYRIYRRRVLGRCGFPVCPEPVHIDIEPTVRCNLRCAFCQRSSWSRSAPDMSLELFKRILNQFPGLEKIKLQGMGEPMLNPAFFEMVAEAKQRNIFVYVFTNGTLFTDAIIESLVQSGIDEVFISCDHYDPGILEKLRPGLNYQSYVEGVRRFNDAAIRHKIRVYAWTLLTSALETEHAGFAVFLKQLGFTACRLQGDITSWGKTAPDRYSEKKTSVAETITRALRAQGIEAVDAETGSYTAQRPCPWPFYHCYITCDGFVQPCCILSDPDRFTFGTIFKRPFFKTWNSIPYFKFRRSFQSKPLYPFCRNCYIQ